MKVVVKKKRFKISENIPRILTRLPLSGKSPQILPPKGFTLIEMFIIIALIGIICAMAVPSVSVMQRSYRLKSAANELASTLQLAKMTGIGQNANCVVTFNTGSQSYSAFSDNGNGGGTINDGVQSGTEPTVTTVNIRDNYYGEITLNSPSFGNTIVFTSQGTCNPSGTVSLQNSAGETLQVVIAPAGSIKIVKP